MHRCESCGLDLPVDAHFCGNCGHLLGDRKQAATDITVTPAPDTPPLFSSPSYPFIVNAEAGQADTDVTIRHRWVELGMTPGIPHSPEREPVETDAVFPDILLPGMLAVQGQMPPAGQAPMVQGTPQAGGVPSVQGAPSAPGNAPPSGPSLPHGAASSGPSHAPTWEPPLHHHQPVHHPQPEPQHHHQPVHHPQPEPPPHEPEHHHPHHHSGPLHAHRPRVPRLHSSTTGIASKVAVGVASKWLIVVLAAVVVVATSGVVFVLANPPGLSLTGNGAVTAGGILHLHGKGFLPGGSITLTLDNGSPVSFGDQHVPQVSSHVRGRNANFTGSSLMLVAGQFAQQSASNTSVSVSPTGTFDVDIPVPQSESPGEHTVHASESLGSRSASLQFTVLPKPAKLVVNPSALDFGSLQIGSKAALSVTVGNTGEAGMKWTASIDSSGTNWLKLQGSGAGVVNSKGLNEGINVVADATNLKVGLYTTILSIHSTGGDAQIHVSLNVVPKSVKKQAQLNVAPQSLDFGQVPANQQAVQSFSVGNLGELPLKWQAATDATSASWLTLSATNGTVQPGALPQTITVLVNPAALAKGSFSGTITVSSNGGNAQVPVALTVLPSQGGKLPPPILTGSPSGFNVPGDLNCTYNALVGWNCTATLSSFVTSQSNLNWSASSSGVPGVAFTPQSGTLLPGQVMPVTISIPNTVCPASATFTFTGPGNQVSMPWSCGALTLSASNTSLVGNTDCTFSNGWTCSVTLGTGPNDQGQLSWSASSSGLNGISFSQAKGVLTAGQSIPITITIPNTACPASATLTFSGQGTVPVIVSWSCGSPTIKVSPTSFSIPTSNCSYVANQGWSCKATIALGSPGDPSVNWSVSGGISGTTFSQPSGIVSAGSPITITINVPDTVCPTQAPITFSGQGANTVTVPWSCAPPALTAAATPSNCPQDASGNYICTDTVSESASSQGSLIWSASASNNLPGVTFNPPNGILGPNGSTKVTITVPANDCTSGSFNYSEQGTSNPAVVTWTCTPPQAILSVSPGSFSSRNCSNNGTTWICSATLTSNATLKWFATSNDPSAISFSQSSGAVSPGKAATVTVYIPYSCPSSATINFVGPSNTVTVSWTC